MLHRKNNASWCGIFYYLKDIKFREYLVLRFRDFSLNCKIKYQGEMLQVYDREIKYPRNLISRDSKTIFYYKKNFIPYYFLKNNLF